MKVHLIAICLTIFSLTGFGQWVSLETPVTTPLYATSFCDTDNGVAVGAGGNIIITNDGGLSWTLQTIEMEDFRSVYMVNSQLIFVGGFEGYRSEDGGLTWELIGIAGPQDFSFIDNMNGTCSSWAGIYETTDGGVTWVCAVFGITASFKSTYNFGETAISMGNINTANTVSAHGVRTEDNVWYLFDNFSFPNANASTCSYLPNPDTVYLFMNDYDMFWPSEINQFVRLTNFELYGDVSEQKYWFFESEVISNNIPDLMLSVYFLNAQEGYACGESGSIYKTTNGGVDWEADYSDTTPLWMMQFVNNTLAYAVGNNGKMLKHDVTITAVIHSEENFAVMLFPNPAAGSCTLNLKEKTSKIEIFTVEGTVALAVKPDETQNQIKLDLANLSSGIYFVRVNFVDGTENITKLIITQ